MDEEQLHPMGTLLLKLVENVPPSLLLLHIADNDLQLVVVLRQHLYSSSEIGSAPSASLTGIYL